MSEISETISAGALRAFIERIERVEEEIRDLNADKSDIYKELRGCGFDVKAVRQCVAARKLDSAEREERNAMFDLYWEALTGSSRVHVHEATQSYAEAKGKAALGQTEGHSASELTQTQEQPETASQSPASEHKTTGHAPRTTGSDDANTEKDDVDRSASARPAGQTIGTQPESIEPGVAIEFIERNTSGPDAKRAPLSPTPAVAPRPVTADDVPPQPASSAPITNPQPTSSPAVDTAGEPQDRNEPVSGSSVTLSEADVPAFLRKTIADYRPNCLHPDTCAASGLRHCNACQKAMEAAEREVA